MESLEQVTEKFKLIVIFNEKGKRKWKIG